MDLRLRALGITTPLPIQSATIPKALAGRHICGQAPTGSGKTLAFGLPMVSALAADAPSVPRGLVLAPTRELAEQIRHVLSSLMQRGTSGAVALYGGVGYGAQRHALRQGPEIVIGCPGRIEDLVGRGDLNLSGVRMVVIDEVDRMVDMGFLMPVCRILDKTPGNRQVLLFSATMDQEVEAISRRYQSDPYRHHVSATPGTPTDVVHHFWRVSRAERVDLTARIVARHGQAFVFCRTKHGADRVARQLRATGVLATPIHGDRTQPQRTRALASFSNRKTEALVATDVVARGIHVDHVPCVVHFDPPDDPASYMHRSGRTGRVGGSGVVISLVPENLEGDVRVLQQALGFPAGVTIPFAESAEMAARGQGVSGAARVPGMVKFFDGRRRYGFLSGPDGGEVYVHRSNLDRTAARRILRRGDRVTFELAEGPRGPEARSVMLEHHSTP